MRLLRPALGPTAAADVVAGAGFAAATGLAESVSVSSVALAACGSVLLYGGGMAQNDLCDRERDKALHPERPLVAEPRLLHAVRAYVAVLFLGGLVLAGLGGALLPAIAVVVLAGAYNLGGKGRFPYDALLLGGARAANLGVGLAAAGAAVDAGAVTYLAGYLLYIGGVTASSRAEDMDPPQTRRLALILALLPKLLALGAFASLARELRWLFLIPFLVVSVSAAHGVAEGTRKGAMAHVLRCLLSIFLIHAVCLWCVGARGSVAVVAVCACASFLLLGLAPSPRPASRPEPGSPPDAC